MTTDKTALHRINGEWIDSAQHRNSVDPATSPVIGSCADGDTAIAEPPIRSAMHVFDRTGCSRDFEVRAQVLEELAVSFERHTEALVEQLALENEKIKHEAYFEISLVPSKLCCYASPARMTHGNSGVPRLMCVIYRVAGACGSRRHHFTLERRGYPQNSILGTSSCGRSNRCD